MMRDSVRDAFVAFTSKFEGVVPWMYLDVKGLVTVAIGNLVDPIQYALPLPFVHKDTGQPATKSEIAAEWERVKHHPTAAKQGHRVLMDVTQLRLTAEGIKQVVEAKLAMNATFLTGRFPEFDGWPADAQLATLSHAWACGPAFRFPLLEAALRSQNWAMAALQCQMDTRGNPGLVPRIAANRVLYKNAACVRTLGMAPEALYYPDVLTDERPTEPAEPSRRPPQIGDFDIVHPDVPLRGEPDNDDDPEAA